jgi:hypothetical protein
MEKSQIVESKNGAKDMSFNNCTGWFGLETKEA